MEKKKIIIWGAVIVAAAAVIIGGVFWGLDAQKKAAEAEIEAQRAAQNEQSTVETNTEVAVEDNTYDFTTTEDSKDISAIQQEYNNDDIYAWISIPGTTVDFPVLECEEDNYYLDHCVDGTEGYPGSIYSNAVDGTNFERNNTILYGHNMKNGSYFGQLHLYEDTDFFNENRDVYIYLSNRKLTYEVIVASQFSNEYLPDVYSFSMPLGAESFLNDVMNFAPDDETTNIADDANIGDWSQLLTLSTCVKGESEKRYMLICKLVGVEMYE